ncbi:MAG: alpha/beta hydrolase-fold protein [Cyanobacteria bacterium]|nr:alpha/beta hydrolase-fold protein [Cyanobacteriota bacterium]
MKKSHPQNILPENIWINRFSSSIPGFSQKAFFSNSMKREIGYGIYIPRAYYNYLRGNAIKKDGFPVIYCLHGKGGNESTGFNLIAAIFHTAIEEGKIKPAIMVFPNCGSYSMFCDSYDNLIMGETILIKELIPIIDSNFRTINSGKGRALEGFSMGGFGAVKLAFKFPDLFSSVVSYAGSFHDLDSLQVNRPEVFKIMFSNNPDYFQLNSPYILAEKNLDAIKKNLKLKLSNGSEDFTLENNFKLNTRLDNLGIKYEFKLLEGLKHIPGPYYESEGLDGFRFHSVNLKY